MELAANSVNQLNTVFKLMKHQCLKYCSNILYPVIAPVPPIKQPKTHHFDFKWTVKRVMAAFVYG